VCVTVTQLTAESENSNLVTIFIYIESLGMITTNEFSMTNKEIVLARLTKGAFLTLGT